MFGFRATLDEGVAEFVEDVVIFLRGGERDEFFGDGGELFEGWSEVDDLVKDRGCGGELSILDVEVSHLDEDGEFVWGSIFEFFGLCEGVHDVLYGIDLEQMVCDFEPQLRVGGSALCGESCELCGAYGLIELEGEDACAGQRELCALVGLCNDLGEGGDDFDVSGPVVDVVVEVQDDFEKFGVVLPFFFKEGVEDVACGDGVVESFGIDVCQQNVCHAADFIGFGVGGEILVFVEQCGKRFCAFGDIAHLLVHGVQLHGVEINDGEACEECASGHHHVIGLDGRQIFECEDTSSVGRFDVDEGEEDIFSGFPVFEGLQKFEESVSSFEEIGAFVDDGVIEIDGVVDSRGSGLECRKYHLMFESLSRGFVDVAEELVVEDL